MFSSILKKLSGDGLLPQTGIALDLGFGLGKEVIGLAELGLQVDAVDTNKENIENFVIEEGKYDCIIASNSLPFITSKEKVVEIIKNIAHGLKKDGCLYITIFGPKDAWADKTTMSFFEYSEIKNVLDNLPLKFYFTAIEEGYGKTMKGDIKYWNIFRFIYTKE